MTTTSPHQLSSFPATECPAQNQTPPLSDVRTIIIGLSGPSSSGKTTLARLLRAVFTIPGSPNLSLSIIHEDDFYKIDGAIPVKTISSRQHGTRDLQDWDCIESLNLDLLQSTLNHVKETGSLPPEMRSKEDQNEVSESGVPASAVLTLREEMRGWLGIVFEGLSSTPESVKEIRLYILDGILLYPDPSLAFAESELQPRTGSPSMQKSSEILLARLHAILDPLLSLRLFLSCTREKTITRRNARSGYVTVEGFWTDPPGYVEDVVWPNFVDAHKWMFRRSEGREVGRADGTGDGAVDVDETDLADERIGAAGIQVSPGKGQLEMTKLLEWAVRVVASTVAGALDLPPPPIKE